MSDQPTESFIVRLEQQVGTGLPDDYRQFLQTNEGRDVWHGDHAFARLYAVREVLEMLDATADEQRRTHPGLLYIGGDGAAEGLAFDLRAHLPPLVLVNYSSSGWSEGLFQAPDFTTFLDDFDRRGWDFESFYGSVVR
jgi:hypothetical protein